MCIEKYVSVKKMFTNWSNMGLPLWTWIEKTVRGVETLWLSGKENFPAAVACPECHSGYLLVYEKVPDMALSMG